MLKVRRNTASNSTPYPLGPRCGLVPERLLWAFRRNPLKFLSGLARDYGDIVLVPLGRRKVYLLNHPDFIRQVLVTDQADFSRGQAHLPASPMLLDSNLHQSVEADPCVLEFLQPLFEPNSLAGLIALVAGHVSLATKDWHTGQVLDLQAELSLITSNIANDLLVELHIPSDLQERTLAILQGGQAAIANVLVSALFLLTEHPDIENRLLAEVRPVFASSNMVSVDIRRLAYTRMFLAETLRLVPPVWVLKRQALRDCNVGGYTIPAGEMVWLSPWLVQHDPRFFPEPWRFDPQRWSAEAQLRHHQSSFFPFGVGSQCCPGEAFSWLQGVLVLALMLEHWKFELLPGHPLLAGIEFLQQPKSFQPIVLKGR